VAHRPEHPSNCRATAYLDVNGPVMDGTSPPYFRKPKSWSCTCDERIGKADLTVLKSSHNLAALGECTRLWREEQSRAIDAGDAAWATHAENCAQRFEAYLVQGRRTPRVATSHPAAHAASETGFALLKYPPSARTAQKSFAAH
jgi:hypothetical protein